MTLPTPTKLREGKVMGIKTQHVGYNLAIEKKKKKKNLLLLRLLTII